MAVLGAGLGSGYPAAIDTAQSFLNTGSPLSDGPTRMDAEVLNDVLGALVAIEAELGIAPSGVWPTLIARLDAFLVGSVAVPQLVVAGAGPHAIGLLPDPQAAFRLAGTYAGGTNLAVSLLLDGALTPAVNATAYIEWIGATINKAASGTHADFASLIVHAPTIGAGAAALTNASTVKITGAPTGATNNYALWVAAGRSILGGGASFLAALTTSTGPSIDGDSTALTLKSGTAAIRFNNQADTVERMRLTDAGILALGTTDVTDLAAGGFALSDRIRFTEIADPAAPAANRGLLYVKDNGAGKTQLVVRFNTGAVQVIATEP